jgi:hypothetical protein
MELVMVRYRLDQSERLNNLLLVQAGQKEGIVAALRRCWA